MKTPVLTTFATVVAAASLLAASAEALDKQQGAHASLVDAPDDGIRLQGAFLLGSALYNPTYPARPDNGGLALMRYAFHADLDLIGRHLSIPLDVNMFTNRYKTGFGKLAPSEIDVITGVTSTWRIGPGALEIGARGETDQCVNPSGKDQSYADFRFRYLYSFASAIPSFGHALADGDLSGWLTLGVFGWNTSYSARPDLSGLALGRYGAHSELSVWHDHLSVALDVTMFTDRLASNPFRPSELDLTPELIVRFVPWELHLAFESDMPLDRSGITQSFLYALAGWAFDLSGRLPDPIESRQQEPHGH